MNPELAGAVAQQRLRAMASWDPGLFHVIEVRLPPLALCGEPVGARLVEFSLRPQGPRARMPYVCCACHLAFMKSISGVLECSRGHGPMQLDTEGEEFRCLVCSERRYPSNCGVWAPAAKSWPKRQRNKAARESVGPFQMALFEIREELGRDVA